MMSVKAWKAPIPPVLMLHCKCTRPRNRALPSQLTTSVPHLRARSCGCNYMRQWDTTFAVPKEVNKIKLFTGRRLLVGATVNAAALW